MSASLEKPPLIQEHEEKSSKVTNKGLFVVNTVGASNATVTTAVSSSNIVGNGDGGLTKISLPSSINIEQHCRLLEAENQSLKASEKKQQQQCSESQRRERALLRRLATKEQELQDYISQISEYKVAQVPSPAALRSVLIDPAVNLLLEKLKKELQATKAKLEETQNELSAWKFTPDSNTGKRLMAKCRLLYQENEELGKMTSNGRLAKLEGELAMQKSFNEEVKKSQSELDDFLQELDEDVEGMQSTILFLQQELKSTRDRIQFLEKENTQLKSGNQEHLDNSVHPISNGKIADVSDVETTNKDISHTRKENDKDSEKTESAVPHEDSTSINKINSSFSAVHISKNDFIQNDNDKILRAKSSNNLYSTNNCSNTENLETKETLNGITNEETVSIASNILVRNDLVGNNCSLTENNCADNNKPINLKKRNYDSDSSSGGCSTNGGLPPKLRSTKLKKKTRRTSVLSIDLNEDDTKMEAESDEKECNTNQRIITRRVSTRNQNGDN